MNDAGVEPRSINWRWSAILSICVLAVHLAIALHLQGVDDSFLRGDRADLRLAKMQFLLHAESPEKFDLSGTEIAAAQQGPLQRAALLGEAGDYLPHAMLYAVGGSSLIVSLQLLLLLAACQMLMRAAQDSGLQAPLAAALALAYALLPGSLLQVHALVVEGLFVPLLCMAIISLWWSGRDNWSAGYLALGVVLLSLAVFVRVHLLLLPLLLAATAWHFGPRARRWRSLWIAAALLPLVSWSLCTQMLQSHTRLEPVGAGSHWHLNKRLSRMSDVVGADLNLRLADPDRPRMSEFLQIAADEPTAFAKTVLIDNANYIANPGVIYLMRQLDLTPADHDPHYWANKRDAGGIGGVIRGLWQWQPMFAIGFLAMAVIWLGIIGLAGLALLRHWMSHPAQPLSPLLLALCTALILYTLASIQLAGQSRWSLRQPAEFALLLLAAHQLLVFWRSRKVRAR